MKKVLFLICFTLCFQISNAQDETAAIRKTLMDYIEGSTEGQPKRLVKAFHPNLNLYYIQNGVIKTWSGKEYIKDTKEGQPTGESGKILSIDYENNIGVAKVEISSPNNPVPYIDYFMLLKENKGWVIVHKAFTKKTSGR